MYAHNAAVTRMYLSKNDDSTLNYAVGLVFLHELTKFEINYLLVFPGKIYILITCINKLDSRKVIFFVFGYSLKKYYMVGEQHCGKK